MTKVFVGPHPTIASLSLGAGRKFQLRKKSDPKIKHEFFLESGDLLIMPGRTQHNWEHAIPKSGKPARINITFEEPLIRQAPTTTIAIIAMATNINLLLFSMEIWFRFNQDTGTALSSLGSPGKSSTNKGRIGENIL